MVNLTRLIRCLSYQSFGVKIVQLLHLSRLMRLIYFLLFFPKNKKKEIFFNGIQAVFQVNDYGELRYIEGTFTKGYRDERIILNRLIKTLQPGDNAYDVGANIGIHTVLMAKRVGENGLIVAIEPQHHNFEALKANIKLNNLVNVIPIKMALGEREGKCGIDYRGRASDIILERSLHDRSDQEVNVVRGDILARDNNLPVPRVVKIDVEGYEYYVIQGLGNTLSNKNCKMVCCEIHPAMCPQKLEPETIIELLESYNFNHIETYSHRGAFHIFCYKE